MQYCLVVGNNFPQIFFTLLFFELQLLGAIGLQQ
ncbi:MAG: hypothetical protein JWP81_4771 [Ferruginibacter sp.]|nr:hypothetical protein [Ferruginibacter sp.]